MVLKGLNSPKIPKEHIGPHLRNERMTEKWAYSCFNAKLGIYQYGRERWLYAQIFFSLNLHAA